MTIKAVGSVRVSTDRQAEKGTSLEAQKLRSAPWRTCAAATLGGVIVDGGESAKDLNRPGVQRLLTLIEAAEVGT